MPSNTSIGFRAVSVLQATFLLFAGCSVQTDVAVERFPAVEVAGVFAPPGESNVRSSFRIDDGVALVGTEESGDIFKTEDGGMTWRKVLDGNDAWGIADVRNYIRADDNSIYITTTEPATVCRSGDDGETWELVYTAPASRTVGLVQLDDGVILVGLRRSENGLTSIIRTHDYFKTPECIPLSGSAPRQNTTCFGYWGGDTVLAGVGYEGSGKVYKSTDRGLTWDLKAEIPEARDVMNFFRSGDSIHVLTSGIGTLYTSTDDGESWSRDQQFWPKGFLGECEPLVWKEKEYLLMCATDQSEEIYRHLVLISGDGGATWHEWIDLASESKGAVYSSKDSGGGASNLSVISGDKIVVGVGNHSVQGRVYTLRVGH